MLALKQNRYPTRTEASKRFDRYKDEKPVGVRKPEVMGDELDELRHKRELLRSMGPHEALQVLEFHKLDFYSGLQLAKKENKILVPNYVMDRIFAETDADVQSWTGTVLAYSKESEFTTLYGVGFEIEIPRRFRDKSFAFLVEYPDFELIPRSYGGYEIRIPDKRRIIPIDEFPAGDGWFGYDDKSRIPTYPRLEQSQDSRFLLRGDFFVGPLFRIVDPQYSELPELRRFFDARTPDMKAVGVALF
jgi:hypothetical protein